MDGVEEGEAVGWWVFLTLYYRVRGIEADQ